MRLLGLLIACLTVIVTGIAIGTVPLIKDNLHWNFWFVIPISGFAFGAAFGWIQFQISRVCKARVGGFAALVLALACTTGFLGTDLEVLLRTLGAKNICLMGINTNTCVLNTAFTAFNKDFRTVVLSDYVDICAPSR